ncbi:zinc ribbon domain-containing protein [Haloquadratum walsbyi]|uniref:zinc ribbon domain-containing protein n=1 Tax=Haloquadratum walsbyi TaxID=293091 RepID=UPI00373FD2B4
MWAFRTLTQCVEYKAEGRSIFVDTVNPKNTSKRCNDCGSVRDDNRYRDEFECQSDAGSRITPIITRQQMSLNCISCEAISRLVGGASVNTL